MEFHVLRSIRVPDPVGPGAHLRVVSPGMPTLSYIPDRARRAERALTEHGFAVSYSANAFAVSDDGTTAGNARQRAADLMAAFADPAVDAVLAADAGIGSRDLLDHLDVAVIRANPKPFIGFCDNVFINQFLATEVGLSSLYGATFMIHIGEAVAVHPETLDYLARALASADPLWCEPMADRTGEMIQWYVPELESKYRPRDMPGGWTWIRPGSGRGPLVGGELTIVPDLVSCFDLSLDSAVLFWDIGYHGLPVEPLFKALCASTDLTALAGMVVGAHPMMPPDDWAAVVRGLVDEYLPDSVHPIVVNADLGHTSPSWTVPYGEEVVLDAPDRLVFRRHGVPRPAWDHQPSGADGREVVNIEDD
jgi:muramoyltetrapeptide carboxypeptidase LdcA involved in peptidoglycan recycling